MSAIRPDILALEQNGITALALPRMRDPAVIPLWIGEGDTVTPQFIRDAAKAALDDGKTFYCHTRGLLELRTAIKDYLDPLYEIDLNPDRITVPGSSMLGIAIAVQMALTCNDHSIIIGPSWPNIEKNFQVSGAQIEHVRMRESGDHWSLEFADITAAIRSNTRAIYINTPSNPTGWVMNLEDMRRLLDLCRDNNILLISDEVYQRNVYEGEVAPSFLSISEDNDPLIVIGGFSKTFTMTGWRLGWMITPANCVRQMAVLSECFNTGAPAFVQYAGIAALQKGGPFIRELQERYRVGREIVMAELAVHPRVEIIQPQGSFYVFARVPGMQSSMEFAQRLLAEEDVGVAPGFTFGPGNEDYFRLCYAQSHDRLREALQRICRFLDRHDNDL